MFAGGWAQREDPYVGHFQRPKWGWGETVGYYTLIMRSVCLTFQLIKNAHAVTWGIDLSVFFVYRKSVEESVYTWSKFHGLWGGQPQSCAQDGCCERPEEDPQPRLVWCVRKGYREGFRRERAQRAVSWRMGHFNGHRGGEGLPRQREQHELRHRMNNMSPIGHCQHFRSHQRQWWAWGLLFPDPLFFLSKVILPSGRCWSNCFGTENFFLYFFLTLILRIEKLL